MKRDHIVYSPGREVLDGLPINGWYLEVWRGLPVPIEDPSWKMDFFSRCRKDGYYSDLVEGEDGYEYVKDGEYILITEILARETKRNPEIVLLASVQKACRGMISPIMGLATAKPALVYRVVRPYVYDLSDKVRKEPLHIQRALQVYMELFREDVERERNRD